MSFDVITAGVPERDGCPALTRIKAFLVDEGVRATLEHVMVNRQGQAVDLTYDNSQSLSGDQSPPGIVMRIREHSGLAGDCEQTYEVEGIIVEPETGTIQALLPEAVACEAGLYQVSFAYTNIDGEPCLINNAIVSVEKTLFGATTTDTNHTMGPPTIQSLRGQIMDTATDNTLLDEVEFSDDQIILAMTKPIQEFNNMNPPLSVRFTAKNFPFRNEWLDASIGYLYQFAAAHYRRNKLNTGGGGMQINDKDKEREYLAASQLMLQQWRDFALQVKVRMNGQEFFGTSAGSYGGYGYGR